MRPLRFLMPLLSVLVAAVPLAASADAAPWHVYNLAPSDRTLTSPQAAGVGGDEATFDFLGTPTTSYLLNHRLAGDITDTTITATFSIDGGGSLEYSLDGGNVSGYSPMARIFFETSTPGSFAETDYWWSHAGAAALSADGSTVTITASVGSPSDWTDFYGQSNTDAFEAAAAHATYVGLSFGGGYFFANGVGVNVGTATFHLTSFEITP